MTKKQRLLTVSGMTPLELLLSVAIVGGMMLIVIFFINRTLALERSRDLVRFNDTELLVSSILQYQIDHNGELPAPIKSDSQYAQMVAFPGQACGQHCPNQLVSNECLYLDKLVPTYLPTIPQDPFFAKLGSSGYYIRRQKGQKTVIAGACMTEVVPEIEIR